MEFWLDFKLSHEFPNLAQTIMGNAEKLYIEIEKLDIDKSVTRHIENIYSQLYGSAFQLEVYSRIIEQKEITKEVVDEGRISFNIHTFIKAVLNGLKTDCKKNGLGLFASFSPDYSQQHDIYVHPTFGLAITNIIRNAVQYAFPSTVINVKAFNNINEYVITIENIGIDIPVDIRTKIFNEGYRGVEARSKSIFGKGLGLSLVKNVLDCHGGTVELSFSKKIANRNIFSISDLRSLIIGLKQSEIVEYLNLDDLDENDIDHYINYLDYEDDEKNILSKQYEFRLSRKIRNGVTIAGDYYNDLLKHYEPFDAIVLKKINNPLYSVRFTIKIPIL